MSTPNPFPDIPVTVAQIIRQAGHKAYQRGLAYARQREVVRYTYDEDENTLEGLVNGSTPIPYEVDIRFFPGSDFGVAARYGAGSRRPGRSIRY